MANKFLGEAGVQVIVDEIKKKSVRLSDFEVWFSQIKEVDNASDISDFTMACSLCVLQTPCKLVTYLHEHFEDCPDFLNGFDASTISKVVSMIETIINDDEYTILWGLPFGIAVQNDALWCQLIAPYCETANVNEITADEVTAKFNS